MARDGQLQTKKKKKKKDIITDKATEKGRDRRLATSYLKKKFYRQKNISFSGLVDKAN